MGETDERAHQHEDFTLSAAARGLVARGLRGERIAAGTSGLDELMQHRLVIEDPFRGHYVLADLRHAQRAMIAEEQQGLAHHQHRLTAITRFFATLDQAAEEQSGGVTYFSNPDEGNAVISQAVSSLSSYMYTAHNVERPSGQLERSAPREIEAMKRGVAMRTLYPDSARGRTGEAEWAKSVSAHGAEIRTLAHDFIRMLLLDGRFAVVSDHRRKPVSKSTGFIITHPGIVALLESVYEQQWDRADPWMGERSRPESNSITNPRSREILRRLERAQTIDQIAAGMSLSRGTINKEIKHLYEATGTSSHFTLGYWWSASEEKKLP